MLSENLHLFLFGFNVKTQKTQLISKGFLKDTNIIPRQRPFPLFLQADNRSIVLMNGEFSLMVIPIKMSMKFKIMLSGPTSIRVPFGDVL